MDAEHPFGSNRPAGGAQETINANGAYAHEDFNCPCSRSACSPLAQRLPRPLLFRFRTAPLVDYHQHLVSPAFAPIAKLPERDGAALLRELDAAGIAPFRVPALTKSSVRTYL
jgi:hypothetical protein